MIKASSPICINGRGLSTVFLCPRPFLVSTSSGTRDFLCTAILSVCLMSSALLTRRAMNGATASRVPISFDDVAVIFSGEEWELISDQQRALYMEVMKENYEHFIFLGLKVPIILSWLQGRNTAAGGTAAQQSSVKPTNHEDPPANHLKGKRPREDLVDTGAHSHPRNGAIKRSSKRIRKNLEQQSVNSNVQDQIQDSPATHGRNLRERKLYYCPHCEKTFNYNSALEAHLRVHSGDKPHKCIDCSQSFSYKSELIVHRRKHSKSSKNFPNGVQDDPPTKAGPQESGPHPNTGINGTSGPSHASAENVPSPVSQTSPVTPNSQASTSSSAPSSLSGSLPQNESEKPLKCNYCEKRFNDKSILEAHHRIHTGKLAYPCSLCDMSFSKPSLLAAHNNTHREGKPFQCDQCDKNFNDQSLLVAHKRTHTGEKPHKCSHCNKWFPNRNSLVEHEECHLKPKPFKCRHCEKSFNDKALLVTHEGVHTDTKPFKCTQCSESFFLKTQLMAHQSNHAPDKPFPCHQCERSFNKKETLLAHIRVHNMQSVQVQKKKNP